MSASPPLTSRDWFGKTAAGFVLGLTLALGISGLLPRLGVGSISYMKTSGQFMMWLMSPIWAGVLSFVFLFRTPLRAWLWLGAANLVVWGVILALGGFRP